jgi:hypothetical protein
MVEGFQSCSTMAQGEGRGNAFRTLVFLPISFFSVSPSPFFRSLFSLLSKQREGGRERMAGAGVRMYGCTREITSFEPRGVGGQAVGPPQTQ